MSHPLIASLSIACVAGMLPLAAQATDDTALSAPNPLLSATQLATGNFTVLHVKSGARMAPLIYGPDFVPKWQLRAGMPRTGASILQGERFRFR
ncbi:MAG TPA: hypothetical protein VHC91_24050 [Trinickia sp.]|uniref:hypothetical protein n=1 Tax=Trinickia sp. TaxID=2571163 RepID=UPI002BB03522|nr:hypothetical protein [Trinickia sp.]HVW53443.1 hypothetical protein [Trinickia sp.]